MTATDRVRPPGDATLEALISERRFVLRSLADLEAEHAAGELTDRRFAELFDQYTVQAATVLRAIDRLHDAQADSEAIGDVAEPAPRRRHLVAAVVATVLVVAAGGGALVRSLVDRQPGQTITGNDQSAVPDLEQLARSARQRPDDFDAQMAYASALMQGGEALEALQAFDAAARLDPAAPDPKAYAGWIVFLAGLTDEALPRLDAAIAADPEFPDARFFRGMVLLRGRDDPAGAGAEFRRYLELTPPGPERDQVEQLLAGITTGDTTTTVQP